MARPGGNHRMLPDQPVASVDPEVERLAHVMVNGLIERLAAEPAVPATSLLDNLGEQLQQAASLRRLNVMRRSRVGVGRLVARDPSAVGAAGRRWGATPPAALTWPVGDAQIAR